jgi:hypothetical protein
VKIHWRNCRRDKRVISRARFALSLLHSQTRRIFSLVRPPPVWSVDNGIKKSAALSLAATAAA